ncbi:MAG: hypothetical protein CMP21_00790 [Rickettsiales bacterium]|nr:hypothetical protein [Rickettsiales bacterium]|tara:strand:+ start:5225 stop:5425 length:201 start_codon:yes stop_codon:yes gene_type:complete
MREKIIKVFLDVLMKINGDLKVNLLKDKTKLFKTGMGSLGFKLEDQLRFDPFVMLETSDFNLKRFS